MRSLVAVLLLACLVCCDSASAAEPAAPVAPVGLLPASVAVLQPVSPGSFSRSYSHSAFRLSSRLSDGGGAPIASARIDVLQQVVGSSGVVPVGVAFTGSDGRFSVAVPAGPSRVVYLAYRGSDGGGVVTQASVFENVTAGLRLRITPARTSPTGTVLFDGRVLGVVPARGVVVEVLVYYLGAWQPVRTPRTDSFGRLRVLYRFHRARGEFPFRLRVRDGQVGFPYGEACSDWVSVFA